MLFRVMNFKGLLCVTNFFTLFTRVLKGAWIMLGLHMVPHSLPTLVTKLIANTASPLVLSCLIPHTEIVEIIRVENLNKSSA